MSKEYKDRGLVKWAPFDALEGHSSMLEELIFNLAKKEKAEMSDDLFEEIDKTIKLALKENKNIYINYFVDGVIYQTFGTIKKIDQINKLIYLNTGEDISFDSVVEARI